MSEVKLVAESDANDAAESKEKRRRRASKPVTADVVEMLREQWLNAQHRAIDLARRAAEMAASLELGLEGAAVASREVEAAQLEATARQVAYQDAVRRFDAQEAALRTSASDKLAKTNTYLAWAIAFATFVQAAVAVVQAVRGK